MTATTLKIEPRFDGDTAILRLEGDFGLEVAAEVGAAIGLLEVQEPAVIVIDLRAVALIDSSGLRVVVEADRRARGSGRELKVIAVPGSVPRRLLELTLLTDLLSVLDAPEGSEPPSDR